MFVRSARLLALLALLASAVLVTTAPARAADADPAAPSADRAGAVLGVVVTPDGRRVPGATVRLVTADGVVIARTLSDDRGGFSFRALRPGHYHVVANKRGVGEGSVRVAVRDDQIVRVRVVLRG